MVLSFIIFLTYWFNRKSNNASKSNNVEKIEKGILYLKGSIFALEHFDSPHFIDYQDAFDVMEVNYFRLKQRFAHEPEKAVEIARDWYRYVQALYDLKSARILLDVDWDDGAWDRADQRTKEPTIAKDEIEKKFNALLGNDFQKVPPDYFKREEMMKKPNEKTKKSLGIANEWKYYYRDNPDFYSSNFHKMEELRRKDKEEKNKKK